MVNISPVPRSPSRWDIPPLFGWKACFHGREMRNSHLKEVEKARAPRGDTYFFLSANTMALECKPTSHFLTAFNFSLSSSSVSFSPTHPPSPLSFLSPLSAPQWPSPTQSLEQCEWETACVTKAIKHTHMCAHARKRPWNTSMQVKIHKCINAS